MKSKLITLILLLVLPSVLVAPQSAQATPGTLDSSFGTNGIASTLIGSSPSINTWAVAAGVQADGKVVVAGTWSNAQPYTSAFLLARYKADGTIDTSFGLFGNGTVITRIGYDNYYHTSTARAHAMAIQPDGSIVVVGSASITYGTGSGLTGFGVARYTSTGALDSSFHGNGTIIIDPVWPKYASAVGVAVQPADGRIVVLGQVYTGSAYVFGLSRLTVSGTLDPSFGSGGNVTTAIGYYPNPGPFVYDSPASVVVQPDGKIVVVGSVPVGNLGGYGYARYLSSGMLDGSFGGNGNGTGTTTLISSYTTLVYSYTTPSTLALQPDGKLLIDGLGSVYGTHGYTNFEFVSRHKSDGTLDTTFGVNGIYSGYGGSATPTGLVLQSNGRILFAQIVQSGGFTGFSLRRLTSNGTYDSTFGADGQVTTFKASSSLFASTITNQTDGKVIIAGTIASGPSSGFAVARYIMTDTAAPVWTGARILSASNVGSTDLTLTWTPAVDDVGVMGYQIYQGSTLLATVAGNVYSYNVTGLSSGTSYTFKVLAGDAAGNWSANGPSLTVSTTGGLPLVPILILVAVIAGFAVALFLTKWKQPKAPAATGTPG